MNTIGSYNSTGDMMRSYFNTANAASAKSAQRIASGKRINSAADDPAGLAVGQSMNAQLTGIDMASRNTQDAMSMVRTADGVLGNVSDITVRMTELATQAGNGTLDASQRAALQEEFSQLSQEIDRIGQSSNFNGNKLFDGSTYSMQVGENSGDSRQVTMGIISTKALGLDKVDLTSAKGAGKALDAIKSASGNVSSQRGALGAMENGMQSVFNNLTNRGENLTASVARIMDTDIAKEAMNMARTNVLSQASTAMMGQANNLMAYNATQMLR